MAVDSHASVRIGSHTVEVEIISPVTMTVATAVDREWGPLLKTADTEDSSWAWGQIIADHSGDRFASFAMVSPQRVEGIIVVERGRIMQTAFVEGTTMHYLATAPWNRLKCDGSPLVPGYERARPVGSVLLTRAFIYSVDEGYDGRLNWETLEGAQKWYREQFSGLPGTLTVLPRSLSNDGYLSFETDSQLSEAYLVRNAALLSRKT